MARSKFQSTIKSSDFAGIELEQARPIGEGFIRNATDFKSDIVARLLTGANPPEPFKGDLYLIKECETNSMSGEHYYFIVFACLKMYKIKCTRNKCTFHLVNASRNWNYPVLDFFAHWWGFYTQSTNNRDLRHVNRRWLQDNNTHLLAHAPKSTNQKARYNLKKDNSRRNTQKSHQKFVRWRSTRKRYQQPWLHVQQVLLRLNTNHRLHQ